MRSGNSSSSWNSSHLTFQLPARTQLIATSTRWRVTRKYGLSSIPLAHFLPPRNQLAIHLTARLRDRRQLLKVADTSRCVTQTRILYPARRTTTTPVPHPTKVVECSSLIFSAA